MERRAKEGGFAALKGVAAGATLELRQTEAHGDQTGATRAGYSVRAVGMGETGAAELARAQAAAAVYNPEHVGSGGMVEIDGFAGLIIDDQMDYAQDRETANAGEKATIGPMVATIGPRAIRAFAEGSRRALG